MLSTSKGSHYPTDVIFMLKKCKIHVHRLNICIVMVKIQDERFTYSDSEDGPSAGAWTVK